jgi:uncharacterized membrane protein YbhN (UPF0104 family)
LTFGLIAAFIHYLYQNSDKYLNLLRVSPLPVILILICTLISMVVNGIINNNLLWSLGVGISVRDGFYLTAASTLANQLPIFGGMLTRAVYLKKKHDLSYTKFFSATLALFFCFVSVNGIIGTGILLFWILFRNITVPPALIFGFVAMALWLMIFWLPVARLRMPSALRARLEQALEGWRLIGGKPAVIGKLVGLQTALMLVLAFRYWLAFQMLSQNVSVGDVVLFSAASVLTQLVGIAPGGLGVTEGIVGGVASLLGFDLGVSIVAVGLDRLISTVVIFLFGGIGMVVLGRQISTPQTSDS